MTQLSCDTAAKTIRKPGIVRSALRNATRSEHATLDAMVSRLDLNGTKDYRLFLKSHLTALVYLQSYWRAVDEEDFTRMLHCLRADLESLACPATVSPATAHKPGSLSRGLGISYVVRGSRLGATMLRRRVTKASLPTSYLDFSPAMSWSQFLLQLELIAGDPRAVDQASLCARRTFLSFATTFTMLQSKPAAASP